MGKIVLKDRVKYIHRKEKETAEVSQRNSSFLSG